MGPRRLAVVRSTICSCCHRRGARYLVRLDPGGHEVAAVCPTCDTRATDQPGWTGAERDDPRG